MDRFLIAPPETGLQLNMPPWLVMDDAFTQLNNAYVWRGRLRRRFGSSFTGTTGTGVQRPLYSRLAIALTGVHGTTDGAGHAAGTVPGTKFHQGQMFSVAGVTFQVTHTLGIGDMLRSDNSGELATYDVGNGAYVIDIALAPVTQVYFYPAEPVMGITQYNIDTVNNHPSYAFDTQFVYSFANRWLRNGTIQFHGDDTQFFWGSNYIEELTGTKALFVTNFNATVGAPPATDDPIYYLAGGVWTAFNPTVIPAAGGNPRYSINQARIIVNFKGRLILLNTMEFDATNNRSYPNRCRFSSYGGNATSATAFIEPLQTGYEGGGYIDAPTDQSIISAQFIKDRLIVYFERSTYELAYTGNQLVPFVWQKLNTELGSQSTFSTIPFDQEVLTCGNSGFHDCNGSNVVRIDDKIPDEVINIAVKNDDNERVCGIRDYATEVVYWSYKTDQDSPMQHYPSRVLLYNYKNRTWAFNDDTITAFGYFEQNTGLTWADYLDPWQSWTESWGSGITQSGYRQTVAGNQFGFIFTIDRDNTRLAPVAQITNMTAAGTGPYTVTIVSRYHNLVAGDFIAISDYTGTQPNAFLNAGYEVTIVDADTFTITATTTPAAYRGNAYFRRLPRIDIYSKQWNPYIKQGRDVFISKIDFCALRTVNGSCEVDYYASSGYDSSLINAGATGTLLGTGNLSLAPYPLIPQEVNAALLWHPIYLQNEGQFIQIEMYYNNTQLSQLLIADADFQIQGLILHCTPTTSRLY